jgi:hypothetical protein
MLKRTISFVALEAVARMDLIEFNHQAVSSDFRDNRGSGNGLDECIPLWNCFAGRRNLRKVRTIHKCVIRGGADLPNSPSHCTHGCLEDINPINLRVVNATDTDRYCCAVNLVK